MNSESNPKPKSSRTVLIVVGFLALAGVVLIGRYVLARRVAVPSPTPTTIVRASGGSATPAAPGVTPTVWVKYAD